MKHIEQIYEQYLRTSNSNKPIYEVFEDGSETLELVNDLPELDDDFKFITMYTE